MVNDIAVQEFVKAIKEEPQDTNKTYNATVSKVDSEGVVWVNIHGSEKETPTSSTSAEVKRGDSVTVNWRNNKLYIGGNYSDPSAGVVRVGQVENVASSAKASADVAYDAAVKAVIDADKAHDAAISAEESAGRAIESAKEASESASNANTYASSALDQLGIVENVVGVLELLKEHGDYQITSDTEVRGGKWYFRKTADTPPTYEVISNPESIGYIHTSDADIKIGKTYYTRSGTGTEDDPYVYTVVENPVVSEIGTYYEACTFYELVGIDTSIQNYVANQLVLDNNGLWLKTVGMNTSLLLSNTEGVVINGIDGRPVASYGATAIIGDKTDFHIEIGDWYKLTEDEVIDVNKTYYTRSGTVSNYVYTEVENPVVADIGTYYEKMPPQIGFYQGENKVSYMNGSDLYVENQLSFGKFAFTQRQNNHFTLKLID